MPNFEATIERRPTLQAFADVNDASWFCFLSAIRGLNLLLADSVVDNDAPNRALDSAIAAELARLTPG